ncbi:cysteinyl-tRNA synthetase [Malassezia pachydermatis]|uniref:Adenylate cyclase n=1 Tax=Malassezia pachydermatis TaxID=77020 RepID=A0A0M9VQL9_9BASI|nr:adenylate cyclase [Malassezia pachydermatis]KOS15692.1 adenylate cyclase [Malassezia pachydermatis]
MSSPSASSPQGIIEAHVRDTKEKDAKLQDTITPWLQDEPVSPTVSGPHTREGNTLRRLNPFQMFRSNSVKNLARPAKDNDDRKSRFRLSDGLHSSPSPKPSVVNPLRRQRRGKVADGATSDLQKAPDMDPLRILTEPLTKRASRDSTASQPPAQPHGVILDTNLDDVSDIVDWSRIPPTESSSRPPSLYSPTSHTPSLVPISPRALSPTNNAGPGGEHAAPSISRAPPGAGAKPATVLVPAPVEPTPASSTASASPVIVPVQPRSTSVKTQPSPQPSPTITQPVPVRSAFVPSRGMHRRTGSLEALFHPRRSHDSERPESRAATAQQRLSSGASDSSTFWHPRSSYHGSEDSSLGQHSAPPPMPMLTEAGTDSPRRFAPGSRPGTPFSIRRTSSPRVFSSGSGQTSRPATPLHPVDPFTGVATTAATSSTWTAPASWAVLHEGAEHDSLIRNIGPENVEEDDAMAWRALAMASEVPYHPTDSERGSITIYEPVVEMDASRDSTPVPTMTTAPTGVASSHDTHGPKKPRFFRRAHWRAESPAGSLYETTFHRHGHQHHHTSHDHAPSPDGSTPQPAAKGGLICVGPVAFGRRGLHTHLPFIKAKPREARDARDTIDALDSAMDPAQAQVQAQSRAPPASLGPRLSDASMIADEAQGKTFLRVYVQDEMYLIISCAVETTTAEISYALSQHTSLPESQGHRLFVYERGTDRPLLPTEHPARLFRRRLVQEGYTEGDGLDTLGKLDMSHLLRFVFRADRVSTLPLPSLQGDETDKHLNLQAMHLTMIPVPVYKYAKWIVSLDLSMNPLTELPRDFVELCTSLRMLRLSVLALKRVPEGVTSIKTLTHLDVSSNRIVDLDHVALHELPELRMIRATNNRLSSVPTYIAMMSSLQSINLSNNRLDTFPARLCAIPHLRDLDLSFNTINQIPPEIGQLKELERLLLAGNSIRRLPAEMQSLQELRVLDVRYTTLHSLQDVLHLPRLERVLADHNYITSIDSPVSSSLSVLHMAHNPLSRAALSVMAASRLTQLDLSFANLVSINETLLGAVPSLTRLVLDHNQLASLPRLDIVSQLQYLSCAGNAIGFLPETIGTLSKLQHLDLHNNNIRTLPSSLWCCKSLISLNVSSNLLEKWPRAEDPSEAPLQYSLMYLRLADNRLGDDVFHHIALLHELEVLNLSMNEIYDIPPGTLSPLAELHELYLSSNYLSALPSDDLERLTKLCILYLNDNKMQSLPAELGRLQQLRAIDVGSNMLKYNIANWHYEWNWNANLELRYLNLSGNQRFEIRPKLAEIDGRERNLADFNRLRHLRLLGLMEVTMTHQPLPDESDHRRVRTTLAHVNAMPYGMADSIGRHDAIHIFDLVLPQYGGNENEALLGLVQGHSSSPFAATHIARFLTHYAPEVLQEELVPLQSNYEGTDVVPTAMRRMFLRLNRMYAEHVLHRHSAHTASLKSSHASSSSSTPDSHHTQEIFWGWGQGASPDTLLWQANASALFAYLKGHMLYIANVGDVIGVLSRAGGMVKVLGTKHEPLDRDETHRIRAAEGWVSHRNMVNDRMNVARAFGHFHLSPVITACPSVLSLPLTDADEFVIIANEELWKHMSYQMAVDIARMDRQDPRLAAQKLRDTALAYGASEYISVMVLTVGGLFHEHLNAHAQVQHAWQRGGIESVKKIHRRGRTDTDSTLARLDREVLPPIGQVALVFTDIKSSTLLWESNPSMQAAIRLHNLLLRRQLRSIGGYEVKTEGDAFMVSFESVSAALLWCFSVQLRLLNVDWPQEILDTEQAHPVFGDDGSLLYRGLSVRMGIHWGWPVCEVDPVNNRMDYFGPMVNRAARISGAADGGQILASQDVVQELERLFTKYGPTDDLPSEVGSEAPTNASTPREVVLLRRMGLGIISMGERRLKGIETPEKLFLLHPKLLAGRYAHLAGVRRGGETLQVYEPTRELVELNQIKQLGYLCMRLESLTNNKCFPGIDPNDPWSELVAKDLKLPRTRVPVPAEERTALVERVVHEAPDLCIMADREDATDAELVPVLIQLITRIRNSVRSLALDFARQSIGGPHADEAMKLLFDDMDLDT